MSEGAEGFEGNSELEEDIKYYKLSWVDYILPVIFIIIGLIILIGCFSSKWGLIISGVLIFIGVMGILNRMVIRLYMNDRGVWIYSGLFPWDRGINGVRWEDLDSALYKTGFGAWVLKAYTIVISHRFTKDSEIIITNVHKGDQFISEVNDKVHEMAKAGRR